MSYRKRMFIWTMLSIAVLATAAIGIEKARPNVSPANQQSVSNTSNSVATPVTQAPSAKVRNLSLQPEAFRLSKRLGHRFKDLQRSLSVVTGTLTIGSLDQAVRLTRRQNQRGERVEIVIGSDPSLLTWDETEGSRSTARSLTETERALVERLTLDSADQFVLGQLRGAAYYTVARSVRPAEAGDSDAYNGPLWTIVRVSNPDHANHRQQEARSRLYYINESTGLIDRIVAEVRGNRIEASFSGWASYENETIPTHIIWKLNDQAVMEWKVNNFARVSQ